MTCFGFRESRRVSVQRVPLRHTTNEPQLERERQRQHELDLLKATHATTGENIVSGIKWVFGSVAAIIILPPVILGAGAVATLEVVAAGAKALGG